MKCNQLIDRLNSCPEYMESYKLGQRRESYQLRKLFNLFHLFEGHN